MTGRQRDGWLTLPRHGEPRWYLPRGAGGLTRSALLIHQPKTPKGLAAWQGARAVAATGLLGLLPAGQPPPTGLLARVAPHLRPGDCQALASTRDGRWIVLVLGADRQPRLVVKLCSGAAGEAALRHETRLLGELSGALPAPLAAPRVLTAEDGLAVFEAIRWRPRLRPWRLPPAVATALGGFFRAGAVGAGTGRRGPMHGDVAPWNLLRDRHGRWVLVDWESAGADGPPFYDVFHHLVQSHVLLGRPRQDALLAGLRQRSGWVGGSVESYARGAGLTTTTLTGHFLEYLEVSTREGAGAQGEQAVAARSRLRRAVLEHPLGP